MRSGLRLVMMTAVVCVTLQAQPSVSLQTPQNAPQPPLIGVLRPANADQALIYARYVEILRELSTNALKQRP